MYNQLDNCVERNSRVIKCIFFKTYINITHTPGAGIQAATLKQTEVYYRPSVRIVNINDCYTFS